jgi:hypothetical protein
MNTITPKEKFVITHPTDENGNEVKFSFMLTLSLKVTHKFGTLGSGEPDTVDGRLIRALGTLEGIDSINPNVGRYTVAATIARTFDPDEVLNELKRRLTEEVLTEIVRARPQIVTP